MRPGPRRAACGLEVRRRRHPLYPPRARRRNCLCPQAHSFPQYLRAHTSRQWPDMSPHGEVRCRATRPPGHGAEKLGTVPEKCGVTRMASGREASPWPSTRPGRVRLPRGADPAPWEASPRVGRENALESLRFNHTSRSTFPDLRLQGCREPRTQTSHSTYFDMS